MPIFHTATGMPTVASGTSYTIVGGGTFVGAIQTRSDGKEITASVAPFRAITSSGYGLSVPVDAYSVSITASAYIKSSSPTKMAKFQLMKNGVDPIAGTDGEITFASSYSEINVGWNLDDIGTLSLSDLTSPDFGFILSPGTGHTGGITVDHVEIRIYYWTGSEIDPPDPPTVQIRDLTRGFSRVGKLPWQ